MKIVLMAAALALSATGLAFGQSAPTTGGWAGKLGASHHWVLPTTPNGLRPTQSWHATASTPTGDIYVAGMDHETNSALYRIVAGGDELAYVGDARAASEAARNWMPGETAQKFHTRPLWHRGRIYVGTMDRSKLDDEWLSRRGLHFYAFDPAIGTFEDLSAREPGGVSAPHGNVVTLASDPARNLVYAAGVPTSEIFVHDVGQGRTRSLGRPASFDARYLYSGRVMWTDSRGRLYFTAGHPDVGPNNPAIYAHVHVYDPQSGFGERKDWPLQEPRALELKQCFDGGRRCFFADDAGHVYRFDDDGPSWSWVGRIALENPGGFLWMFQVSPDRKTAYGVTSLGQKPSVLLSFDLESGKTRRLCDLQRLDPALADATVHTGYDAWDGTGRLYFTSSKPDGAVVTRLDPERAERLCARESLKN